MTVWLVGCFAGWWPGWLADPVSLDLNTVHWLAVSVRPVSHLNRGDCQSYQPLLTISRGGVSNFSNRATQQLLGWNMNMTIIHKYFSSHLYFRINKDMIWYDMIWYDMIWYDMIWYYIIWYDMIWYDMIWHEMICYDLGLTETKKPRWLQTLPLLTPPLWFIFYILHY